MLGSESDWPGPAKAIIIPPDSTQLRRFVKGCVTGRCKGKNWRIRFVATDLGVMNSCQEYALPN